MTTITEVLDSFAWYAECRQEEQSAREGYEGYSWGYHGHAFIEATSKAEKGAKEKMDAYIKERINEALSALKVVR